MIRYRTKDVIWGIDDAGRTVEFRTAATGVNFAQPDPPACRTVPTSPRHRRRTHARSRSAAFPRRMRLSAGTGILLVEKGRFRA
jgi:hypothetical protein